MLKGVVRGTGGGVYRVALEGGPQIEASLRGRLKRGQRTGHRVVIGDRVRVERADDDSFTIEAVEPRTTEIVRRGPGGRRPKVVAANLERMVAVVAAAEPSPRTDQIDRLLVIAEANGVEAALVVNKIDLPGAPAVAERLGGLYRPVGYPVLAVSALEGTGMNELRALVCRGSSALVGPSGAGKSSLLNALDPSLELRTGELSRKVGRGRHTTVAARLIELDCGGLVADTPGFGDVGVWGLEPRDVEGCFRELARFRSACRFQDCAHLAEPDCAVQEAVERGEVSPSRYDSYKALILEARRGGPEA